MAASLVGSAHAQQVVETSTGIAHGGQSDQKCGFSQAMLAATEKGKAARQAETKARINALLDSALASSKVSPQAAQSPVLFRQSLSGS